MNPFRKLVNNVKSILKKELPTKVTAKEFLMMIAENPAVFEHWETPLEITEFINCSHSNITYLSKHLTFSGRNKDGETANFSNCANLKTATGTFHGFANFYDSGIEKIEELHITEIDKNSWAANFAECQKLRTATGTFPGVVSFFGSGIHTIENLHILKPGEDGTYGSFECCSFLFSLKNWDLSKEIRVEPELLKEEKKRREIENFVKKTQPQELPFL